MSFLFSPLEPLLRWMTHVGGDFPSRLISNDLYVDEYGVNRLASQIFFFSLLCSNRGEPLFSLVPILLKLSPCTIPCVQRPISVPS